MTPLERAELGVKAEMFKQFGKHAENSKRPIHYAKAALDAAPDFDQLTEYLRTHNQYERWRNPMAQECVACLVEDFRPSDLEILVRAFISYLQQGVEQEQPHLAAVAA